MTKQTLLIIKVVFGVLLGLFVGLGFFTFYYAKGGSYLLNDPKACMNCHVMQDQYAGWIKGSHRNAATCNDCHNPHTLIGKYLNKAENGFWHSFAFTTGQFHEPIQIKPHNRKITEDACRFCHGDIVKSLLTKQEIFCTSCHYSVGHLK